MKQCTSTFRLDNIAHFCIFRPHTEGNHTNAILEWTNEGQYRSLPPQEKAATLLRGERAGNSHPYTATGSREASPGTDTIRIARSSSYGLSEARTGSSPVTVRPQAGHPYASGLTYAKIFAFSGIGACMWIILIWLVIILVRTWETLP